LRGLLAIFAAVIVFGATPAVAERPSPDDELAGPKLQSSAALVLDQHSGEVLYGKNAQTVAPIASITKLMTAMLVLDARLDLGEHVAITQADVDVLRGSRSRLRVGARLTRDELLRLSLMASENRAASALGRTYPGGTKAFVHAMNVKARLLGMGGTRFADATGLSSANVSTAEDLATLVNEAHGYARIREYSTLKSFQVKFGKRAQAFRNTNRRRQLEYRIVQDRLHQRGGPLSGDAGDARRPGGGDRTARFLGKVFAHR